MRKGKSKNRSTLGTIAWGEPDPAFARGVCESIAKCSPWAAKPRGFINGATCALCVVGFVALVLVLAVSAGVSA